MSAHIVADIALQPLPSHQSTPSAGTPPSEEIYVENGANPFSLPASRIGSPSPGVSKRSSFDDSDERRLTVDEIQMRELSRIDGGWEAWKFVGGALLLELVIWGYGMSFGVLQNYLSSHPPFNEASTAAISAVGTVALAIGYVAPPPLIIVFRRHPHLVKRVLWSAMGVSVVSMLASSFATSIATLIILQGVVCGTASAVLYVPVLMYIQEWFVEKRGLASGIIFSGMGLGGFIFPFMMGGLLDSVGFAWTIRIWSLFTLVTFSIALAIIKPRLPATKILDQSKFKLSSPAFLKDPVVIVMTVTTFFASLAYFPVTLFIPTFATDFSPLSTSSPQSGTIVLAIFNASSVFSQLGVGYAADHLPYSVIIAFLGLASSLVAFCSWGFADTLAKTLVFGMLFGIFSGVCSTWTAVSKDAAGRNPQLASLILSFFGISRGLAAILGPMIASALYESGASPEAQLGQYGNFGFKNVTIFVGSMAAISAFVGAALGPAKKWKTRAQQL